MKIRVQPQEWFEKNCYKDDEGDWWENKETADIYFKNQGKTEHEQYEKFLYFGDEVDRGDKFGKVVDVDVDEKISWEWAVQEYITKEKYPEYYL